MCKGTPYPFLSFPILSDPFLHLSGPPESSESLGVLPEPSDFTLLLLD